MFYLCKYVIVIKFIIYFFNANYIEKEPVAFLF